MPTLYVDDQRACIRISGKEFIVASGGKEGEHIPFSWVERIVIAGNVQISTPALIALLKESIPVCFISTKGNYRGCLQPELHNNAELRMMQCERFRDELFRLKQARTVLAAKLKNCRTLLLKHHRSHADFHCDMEAEGIARELHKMKTSPSIEGLMGHEGVAAHWYFTALGRMCRREFHFTQRSRRPPRDPVNALLSLGYTLLYNEFSSAVQSIGLDHNIGFLHAIEYGRASLASDMVEEFRWLIDGLVLAMVNRGVLVVDDFIPQEDGGFRMADDARKKFYGHYEERMHDEVTYEEQHVSYRRIFFRQAEHLARVILGKEDSYAPYLIQ